MQSEKGDNISHCVNGTRDDSACPDSTDIRNETMRKMNFYVVFAIIVILAVSAYFFLRTPSKDDLARCLTDNGAVMYGTSWCGHCKTQKDLFGESFRYVAYVDCDLDPDTCKEEGITGYPTWRFKRDNITKAGAQTLSSLSKLANC